MEEKGSNTKLRFPAASFKIVPAENLDVREEMVIITQGPEHIFKKLKEKVFNKKKWTSKPKSQWPYKPARIAKPSLRCKPYTMQKLASRISPRWGRGNGGPDHRAFLYQPNCKAQEQKICISAKAGEAGIFSGSQLMSQQLRLPEAPAEK